MSSTAGAAETPAAEAVAADRDLWAAIWLTLLLLAAGLSLFLTWRRIVGALIAPPSGMSLVVAAITLALAVALMRSLAREHRLSALGGEYPVLSGRFTLLGSLQSRFAASRLWFALPGIVALLLLTSVTLPRTPVWGIASAWLVFIASESTSWLMYLQTLRRLRQGSAASVVDVQHPRPYDEPEIPAGLVQQLTRTREIDRESLHALVKADIAAHDRLAVVHLAFCPPFVGRPELMAHALEAEDAEIRLTQVETFGVRIEVRLPQANDEPRSVLIEVLGTVTCPPGA